MLLQFILDYVLFFFSYNSIVQNRVKTQRKYLSHSTKVFYIGKDITCVSLYISKLFSFPVFFPSNMPFFPVKLARKMLKWGGEKQKKCSQIYHQYHFCNDITHLARYLQLNTTKWGIYMKNIHWWFTVLQWKHSLPHNNTWKIGIAFSFFFFFLQGQGRLHLTDLQFHKEDNTLKTHNIFPDLILHVKALKKYKSIF